MTENMEKDIWDKTKIIGTVLGAVLIPVIIGIMSYMYTSNQTKMQQEQEHSSSQLKLFGLIYNDIVSDNPTKRKMATGIIEKLDDSLIVNVFKGISKLDVEEEMKINALIKDNKPENRFVDTKANQSYTSILNSFKILEPEEGDSIGLFSKIIGMTPFTSRNHYLRISVNDEIFIEKIQLYQGDTWNQNFKFGNSATPKGTVFNINAIAVPIDSIVSDKYNLPKGTQNSNSINLIRK